MRLTVIAPCPAACGWTVTSTSGFRDAEDQAADHYQREHVDPLRCPRCSTQLMSDQRAQRRGWCDLCDATGRVNRAFGATPVTSITR